MVYMAKESMFLKHAGDNPRMRILQHLIEGRDFDYTLTDLLKAGVSWGTLNTLVPKLFELGVVVKTRKIGRATLYKINQKNVFVKQLIRMYDTLILEELERIEEKQTEKSGMLHKTLAQENILARIAKASPGSD